MMAGVGGTLKRNSHVFVTDNPRLVVLEHFDIVHDRVEVLLRSAKGLLSLAKKRISLEKERIKSLGKITSSIYEESKGISFEGVLLESWQLIQQHSQQETMHRSKVLTSLEEKVIQPLSVFLLSDLEKRFQNITSEVRQKVKEYHQYRLHLQKGKERYFSACAEWENQLLLLYKDFGAIWEPIPGNKLYEKEQQICKKLDEARLDYECNVENLNANVQALTLQHLPQAFTNMEETTEQMVSVIHSSLKNFELLQSSLIGQVDIEMSSACSEFFIVPEFCKSKIFNEFDLELLPLPPSFNFDEYSYKDAALEIQARKTQYRAMSLLSPSELATRGAIFLGGTKGVGSKGSAVKLQGLNHFLVEVCVEYLQQPAGLQEEGIFRVPGDVAVIRSLHADFMTAGQDQEMLKAKIMGQVDPNNVSGLLKLHLRENSLLSRKVLSNISEILASETQNEVPSPIFKDLSANCSQTELTLLSKITNLMVSLTSEPWTIMNKMTARTLGIACGLSLFPQFNPGQATQLLEYLIKHSSELDALAINETLLI